MDMKCGVQLDYESSCL